MYVLELNDAPHKGKNFTKRGKKKMSNTQSGCPPWLKQAIMYLVSPPSTPLSKPPLFQIVEVCAWSSSLHLTNRRHSFIIISPHSTHSSHRHTNIGSRVTTMVCVERSNASNSCTCITYSNGSSTKVCIITTLYRYIYIYISSIAFHHFRLSMIDIEICKQTIARCIIREAWWSDSGD
jgi:hypothetical protein